MGGEASRGEGEVRPVVYSEGDAGIWSLDCATCPLIPHAKALGAKAKSCMAGIATNMQGPLVLSACEHYEAKSFTDEGGKAIVKCKFPPPSTPEVKT